MVEGIDSRCSQKSCLAHASAKPFSYLLGPLDVGLCAEQHRTNRAAQAFAEADGNGIKLCPPIGGAFSGLNQGIEQSGTIEVELQAFFFAERMNRLDFVEGIDASPSLIHCIFYRNQRGFRCMHIVWVDGFGHLRSGNFSQITRQKLYRSHGIGHDTPCLIEVDVGILMADDLFLWACMQANCDLVGHRARGAK